MIITLTTDFGTSDHYVAAIKGAILSAAPKLAIVDVTHDLPRGGIVQAGFVLAQLPASFPPNTVHLAVVDPTVGTRRAILAATVATPAGRQFFVAPDNGLLTYVQRQWGLGAVYAVRPVVDPLRPRSETFDGRDVMAPAAAALALNGRPADLGPPVAQMEMLDLANPAKTADGAAGQVIHVDHFGNCTTNLPATLIRSLAAGVGAAIPMRIDAATASNPDRSRSGPARGAGLVVYAGQHRIGPLVKTYAEVPAESPAALIGSAGLLEIAVNMGSAAEKLGLAVGSPVSLRYE